MSLFNFIGLLEGVISQMPGFIGIHDKDSRIVLVNQGSASNMGYRTTRDAIGTFYQEMKCKAHEDADNFVRQDQTVLNENRKLRLLSYHQWHTGTKIVIGEKSPLVDARNKIMGIISHWVDVTDTDLIDISRFLFESVRKFNKTYFAYTIENVRTAPYLLTERQLECLFFFIRGKSIKEIAQRLELSTRTVEEHIYKIKEKMDCRTRSALVEKALQLGMLTILPQRLLNKRMLT